jgi:hypothetical protein
MTILIPILYPFKFIKVSIKTYKMIKTAKYTIKIAQKIKKIKYFLRDKIVHEFKSDIYLCVEVLSNLFLKLLILI